jgi:hypothetical protein
MCRAGSDDPVFGAFMAHESPSNASVMSYHVADTLSDLSSSVRVMSDPTQCRGTCKVGICTITLKDAYCCFTQLYKPQAQVEGYAESLGGLQRANTTHSGHAQAVTKNQDGQSEARTTGLQGKYRHHAFDTVEDPERRYSEESNGEYAVREQDDRGRGQQAYRDNAYDTAGQQYDWDIASYEGRSYGEKQYDENPYGYKRQQEYNDCAGDEDVEMPYDSTGELDYRSKGQPVYRDNREQAYGDNAEHPYGDVADEETESTEGREHMENSSFFHGGEGQQEYRDGWDRRYHCWM